MKENNLVALSALGQSPWYDNIDRRLVQDGTLEQLFKLGITGVTSNPSIFEKAINGSDVYDEAIRQLANAGNSPNEIYNIITVQDVQSAADLLYATYENTHGKDGYVSLEVLPDYAHNTAKTIDNAREIYEKVARPNLMVKVPGTKEGPSAIRVLTREGINVNVTLLFSLDQYKASATAYMEGLRERLIDGNSLDKVCSVASVFVSRVDTQTDKLLAELGENSLKGKVAIANAKMIYQKFKELFSSDAFRELALKGGHAQRVLWGSTGTKNPDYSDVKYVDGLVGRDTINTLPHETLEAVLDHGSPRLTVEGNLEEELGYLEYLERLGIDLDGMCDELQELGVQSFADSFQRLIRAIVQKMKL